jgi:hypothetical protein
VYRGTVVRDDGRSGWLVRYEDGDEEHLSERGLLELMRADVEVVPSDSSGSSGDDDVRGDWAAMDRSRADERAASDRSSRIDARRPPLAVCGRAASGGGGGEMRVGAAYSALTASFPSTLGMFASALLLAPANVAAPSAAASHAYAALTASFPSTVGMFASALPAPAAGGTRQGLTLAQRRAIASRARQQAPPLPPAADTSLAGLGRDLRRRAAGAVRPFVPTPDRPRGPLERQSGRQHNAQRTPVAGRNGGKKRPPACAPRCAWLLDGPHGAWPMPRGPQCSRTLPMETRSRRTERRATVRQAPSSDRRCPTRGEEERAGTAEAEAEAAQCDEADAGTVELPENWPTGVRCACHSPPCNAAMCWRRPGSGRGCRARVQLHGRSVATLVCSCCMLSITGMVHAARCALRVACAASRSPLCGTRRRSRCSVARRSSGRPMVRGRRLCAAPLPHLHRDWAHPCYLCTGTGLTLCHICTGTGLTPATSAPGLANATDGVERSAAALPTATMGLPSGRAQACRSE